MTSTSLDTEMLYLQLHRLVDREARTANSTYKKLAVQCFV